MAEDKLYKVVEKETDYWLVQTFAAHQKFMCSLEPFTQPPPPESLEDLIRWARFDAIRFADGGVDANKFHPYGAVLDFIKTITPKIASMMQEEVALRETMLDNKCTEIQSLQTQLEEKSTDLKIFMELHKRAQQQIDELKNQYK